MVSINEAQPWDCVLDQAPLEAGQWLQAVRVQGRPIFPRCWPHGSTCARCHTFVMSRRGVAPRCRAFVMPFLTPDAADALLEPSIAAGIDLSCWICACPNAFAGLGCPHRPCAVPLPGACFLSGTCFKGCCSRAICKRPFSSLAILRTPKRLGVSVPAPYPSKRLALTSACICHFRSFRFNLFTSIFSISLQSFHFISLQFFQFRFNLFPLVSFCPLIFQWDQFQD